MPIDEVCGWLNTSTIEVFETMFSACAFEVPPPNLDASGENLVVGSIGFVGDANGDVFIYVTHAFARKLTAKVLELNPAVALFIEMRFANLCS